MLFLNSNNHKYKLENILSKKIFVLHIHRIYLMGNGNKINFYKNICHVQRTRGYSHYSFNHFKQWYFPVSSRGFFCMTKEIYFHFGSWIKIVIFEYCVDLPFGEFFFLFFFYISKKIWNIKSVWILFVKQKPISFCIWKRYHAVQSSVILYYINDSPKPS